MHKQQVVLFERALWGGGAERIVYHLSHGFDQDRFEVHIVHLFDIEHVPVSFGPSITIHSVESLMRQFSSEDTETSGVKSNSEKGKGILRGLLRICRSLSPDFGSRPKLGKRLQKLLSIGNPVASASLNSKSVDEIRHVMATFSNIMPQVIALEKIFSTFREDAVIVSIMEEATVRLWLKQIFSKQTYIASLHTAESHYMPVLFPDEKRLSVNNWMLENACRNAQCVIMPTEGCRNDLITYYGLERGHVKVISNPVNRELILKESKASISPDIPGLGNKTVFVHVGRLSYEKNHALLVDTCQLLRERFEEYIVLCLGSGNLQDQIQTSINEKGLSNHILLLGKVSNPFPFMAKARSLVLTSHFESFALVLVEAMICGAVPISVDCPFGPREVLDNGRYGLLVPQDDPQVLADAMYRIAHDHELYQMFRSVGSGRAMNYDASKVVKEWERLLFEVHNA